MNYSYINRLSKCALKHTHWFKHQLQHFPTTTTTTRLANITTKLVKAKNNKDR